MISTIKLYLITSIDRLFFSTQYYCIDFVSESKFKHAYDDGDDVINYSLLLLLLFSFFND